MKRIVWIVAVVLLCCPSALLGEETVFTPSGSTECSHAHCYWTTPMDITDEAAVWAMLMSPVTVISGNQREQIALLDAPGGKAIGEITCDSQSVHVLEEDQSGWTKVETYSSSFHNSDTKAWNQLLHGYVETARLKTVTPASGMGIVVDKLTQRLYLFVDGHLYSELRVSTGLPNARQPYNETRSGEFFLVSKVGDFRSDDMMCEKGIRFNGGDLLHQVPYVERNGSKVYDTYERVLGQRASHGCIRLQRKRSPEGVNITWIWNHYEKYTKLVVWEDWLEREKPAVPKDTLVYIRKGKDKVYHRKETCYSLNAAGNPTLTAIPFSALEEPAYASFVPCVWCNPPEK